MDGTAHTSEAARFTDHLAIRYERRDDVHLASALVCLNFLPPGAGF